MPRIYLSPPHLSGLEQQYVKEAFAGNWVAPLGPNVDAFEAEFCAATGAPYALATSSGTVWTPTPGWQTKVCPNWVSMATGIRSSGLKPSDL